MVLEEIQWGSEYCTPPPPQIKTHLNTEQLVVGFSKGKIQKLKLVFFINKLQGSGLTDSLLLEKHWAVDTKKIFMLPLNIIKVLVLRILAY